MSAVTCAIPGQDLLGETPLWCEQTQCLLWLDIDGGKLQRFHPATGRHDVFGFDAKFVGCLALTTQPQCVMLALDLGLHLFDMGTGGLRLVCQVEPEQNDNRLNDGRCDALGNFWVGTMDNQLHRPNGAFYRVDPQGQAHRLFQDVIVSNTVMLDDRARPPVFLRHAPVRDLAVRHGRRRRHTGQSAGVCGPQRSA
ncbi:SMP-30/gluconolactonase/LRE family protein [Hydrogenophaga sp.]|uniref:SMP-30/gluconolactonase/LRE family protein n=1 Tax=Hydrogenophaga sp. TaxID=1904254 RepID=UPI003D2D8EBB